MVFAIDGRGLTGAPRGVARYARAMVDALRAGHPSDDVVLLEPGAGGTRRRHAARMALTGAPTLEGLVGGADAIWAPAPRPLAVGPATGLVLTVHDRSWELRPGDFTAYERLWHRVARPRRLAARADRVLFDAAPIRDDVVRTWALDASRTRLAPPGVDAPNGPPGPLPAAVRAPFFLWVGAIEPRKGPDVLAAAWARARADGLRASLVVLGDGREASTLDVDGAVRLDPVDDPTLAALYAGAIAVVAPSRAEGYGLVPLEALAHGTPAIVTDLPVWRQSLGAAALRVPVDDAMALAAALQRLEEQRGLRADLAAAAPPRRTWANAAAVLHAALHEAVAERRALGGR